jgi:ABC-type transport system involved in Fe-S cluster assembly fused permease/ATPase subunit
MDRGTDAADTVVTYLFLYLLPAIGECVAVCIVFLLHFKQWDLALLLFSSLILYGAYMRPIQSHPLQSTTALTNPIISNQPS